MANLVIVASGRATRLNPIHQDLYPKLLINYGQVLFIEQLIESYRTNVQIDSITIIVPDEKAEQQIREAYINVKGCDDLIINGITFIHYPNANGTAETINDCILLKVLPTENVIITWSDIFPTDFTLSLNKKDTIYLDRNPVHRIGYDVDNELIYTNANQQGNIPGIFFFQDLNKIFDLFFDVHTNIPYNADLTFILGSILRCTDFYFPNNKQVNIVDSGDIPKYEKLLENVELESRYFNELEFTPLSVVKKTNTEYGEEVLANELSFYKYIDEIDLDRKLINMPMLINSGTNWLRLERVEGETVHQYLNGIHIQEKGNDTKLSLYLTFLRDISNLHEIKSPEMSTTEIVTNTYKEYYMVTCERLNKMNNILPDINFVNGILVESQSNILKYVHNKIEDFVARLMQNGMRLIHGDPNSSNVMINTRGKLIFIDPRGRFGNLKFYGDPYYDYAKFLYGLTGYDEFNLTKDLRFKYDPIVKEITVPLVERIEKQLDLLTDDDDLKFLVGLIWLKLPYYTINNLNKSVAAYAIGLRLITKYLK